MENIYPLKGNSQPNPIFLSPKIDEMAKTLMLQNTDFWKYEFRGFAGKFLENKERFAMIKYFSTNSPLIFEFQEFLPRKLALQNLGIGAFLKFFLLIMFVLTWFEIVIRALGGQLLFWHINSIFLSLRIDIKISLPKEWHSNLKSNVDSWITLYFAEIILVVFRINSRNFEVCTVMDIDY